MSPDWYIGSYNQNNPQSFNRYGYVLNSPVNKVDPLGLDDGLPQCQTVTWSDGEVDVDGCPWGGLPGTILTYYGGEGEGGGGTSGTPGNSTPTCDSLNTAINLYSKFAKATGAGLFFGGSIGAAGPGYAGGVSGGFYADGNGNVSIVFSRSIAIGGSAGFSFGYGLTFGTSRFRNGGFFGLSSETSVSAGLGPTATGTFSQNSNGFGTTLTVGPGAGLSASTGISNTTPVTQVCHYRNSVFE